MNETQPLIEEVSPQAESLLLAKIKPILLSMTAGQIAASIVSLVAAVFISRVIYRLTFHPLSKYPGSFLCKISSLPWFYYYLKNANVSWVEEQHTKYGPTVRLAPNHLSFIQPEAWKEIYGHKTATHKSNPKDKYAFPIVGTVWPLVTIPSDQLHSQRRKIFNNAFSDRALMQQESMIALYVDQCMNYIKSKTSAAPDGTAHLDAVTLFNCIAFDVISDLTFGDGLGLSATGGENGNLRSWVEAMNDNLKVLISMSLVSQIPTAGFLYYLASPKGVIANMIEMQERSAARVEKRLAQGADARPDIWGLVLKKQEEQPMPRAEMNTNAAMFMTAGTETTATSLSGIMYLLARNPEKKAKLVAEVRAVPDESHLTADSVRHMKYLCAVIEEGMRIYPAIAFGNIRNVPEGGNVILGDYLPAKTRINVAPFSCFRSPLYWKDPLTFLPERWLIDDKEYAEYHEFDQRGRAGFMPFGTGARACIGKNLAYYELRIIIAKFIYNFDFELLEGSDNWMEHQTGWILWNKPPMPTKIWERK